MIFQISLAHFRKLILRYHNDDKLSWVPVNKGTQKVKKPHLYVRHTALTIISCLLLSAMKNCKILKLAQLILILKEWMMINGKSLLTCMLWNCLRRTSFWRKVTILKKHPLVKFFFWNSNCLEELPADEKVHVPNNYLFWCGSSEIQIVSGAPK